MSLKVCFVVAIACGACGTVKNIGTPVIEQIAPACGVSPTIQWSAVAGASYSLSYGIVGNLTTVEVPEGTTSYQTDLPPGSYIARVQAIIGTDNGPVSV